jgi:hypothetical protein
MKTYLVGGAVRDMQLGLEPKDRDWVIVGATPEDVQALIDRGYQQVGIDFPVFLHPNTGEEYALARVERKVGVGYHGFEVSTEDVTIEQDLARRDLTVNAMAIAPDGSLIDPFGGVNHLRNQILQHTSPAFVEDPLRVLRLARFAARLNWKIAPETRSLCRQLCSSGELNTLAGERIWMELEKGFSTDHPTRFIFELYELGAVHGSTLLSQMLPDLPQRGHERLLRSLSSIPANERFCVGLGSLVKALPKVSNQRVRSCAKYAEVLRKGVTSEHVLNLITQAGGLQEHSGPFQDLIWVILIHEAAGLTQLRADRVLGCVEQVRQVRAAEFSSKEGPELGQAIRAKRLAIIKEICDL